MLSIRTKSASLHTEQMETLISDINLIQKCAVDERARDWAAILSLTSNVLGTLLEIMRTGDTGSLFYEVEAKPLDTDEFKFSS